MPIGLKRIPRLPFPQRGLPGYCGAHTQRKPTVAERSLEGAIRRYLLC